jgi:hypothetical protein
MTNTAILDELKLIRAKLPYTRTMVEAGRAYAQAAKEGEAALSQLDCEHAL